MSLIPSNSGYKDYKINKAMEDYPRPRPRAFIINPALIIGVMLGAVLGLGIGITIEKAISNTVAMQLEEKEQW